MRKRNAITGLILAFAITAFAIPSQSLAQGQSTEQATFGNLIAALNNISVEIDELEALNDLNIEDVQVVNVEDVLRGANIEALNNALNNNEVEIIELENVLNNNEVIKNALNNLDVDVAVGDVVAVDVLSGGDVIVYYQQ